MSYWKLTYLFPIFPQLILLFSWCDDIIKNFPKNPQCLNKTHNNKTDLFISYLSLFSIISSNYNVWRDDIIKNFPKPTFIEQQIRPVI